MYYIDIKDALYIIVICVVVLEILDTRVFEGGTVEVSRKPKLFLGNGVGYGLRVASIAIFLLPNGPGYYGMYFNVTEASLFGDQNQTREEASAWPSG